jgi:hypothetical protein
MAESWLILRRDQSVMFSNKIDQEIASAINRVLFHQKAPAHIRLMNAKRNSEGRITVIMQHYATVEMAMSDRYIIIIAARTVNSGVVDVEENKSRERIKIHAVPQVRYSGNGKEGLRKIREEFEGENKGVAINTHVWWLVNPCRIRDRRLNGDVVTSSVVFVIKERKLGQSLINTGI